MLIRNLELLKQHIDFSAFKGKLPRNIHPTDIDCAFGIDTPTDKVLLLEYKRDVSEWSEVSRGQRRFYASLVRIGQGKVAAALVKHKHRDHGELINAVDDVESFQVMRYEEGKTVYSSVFPGKYYLPYVQLFVSNQ